MGLVQCFVIVLMVSAQLVLPSPLQTDGTQYCTVGGRMCRKCPAGQYQSTCAECESCPAGSYTTELNCEERCHACFRDCRPAFHLKVVQNCTSKSNMECVCEEGFRCIDTVPYSANCRNCAKIQETSPTEAAAVISGTEKHTPSSASPGHTSTSTKPCRFPKCGPPALPPAGNHTQEDRTSSQLAAILCPLVLGCAALVILFFIIRPGDETCFKRAFAKFCSEGGRDASHKPQEATHQLPRDSFSAKQQLSCLSAANLGPVHVHNPGTVIFSLLSQFTGQVGPTIEGEKKERVISEEEEEEEEDERDCPVFHPTSSPSIHLSEEEERSGDDMFFPSQEQGKDCHVSKEEAL